MFLVIEIFCSYLFVIYNVIERKKIELKYITELSMLLMAAFDCQIVFVQNFVLILKTKLQYYVLC